MTDQLIEIGRRLGALREIMGLTAKEMAGKMNVAEDEYKAYEDGGKDFSFSFLLNAAEILGVDVIDIMSGDSPKLSTCALVRSGRGFNIERRKAYDYKHLAFTFRNKKAEPFLVTVEPKETNDVELHAHDGQEFNYMLEGSMAFYLGEAVYELNAGDSVYFNSGLPHAMRATGGKAAKFIAVVL